MPFRDSIDNRIPFNSLKKSLVEITAPATDTITLAEAKDQIKVEISDDDTIVGTLITAVRIFAERDMNLSFVDTIWDMKLDYFPHEIRFPRSPLSSVTSIKYNDENGVEQTLATTEFTVDSDSLPGRVVEAEGKQWPTTQNEINAVTIRFVAGYGGIADVPEDIKAMMKLLFAYWYENREAFTLEGQPKELPMALSALMDIRRIVEIY